MWTVMVTLPDGGEEVFADARRLNREWYEWNYAWAYSYEVDGEALRVFRVQQRAESGNGAWQADGQREEIAYFRSHQWERVRGG